MAPSFQDVLLLELTGGLVATPHLNAPLPSSLRCAPSLRTALASTISDLGLWCLSQPPCSGWKMPPLILHMLDLICFQFYNSFARCLYHSFLGEEIEDSSSKVTQTGGAETPPQTKVCLNPEAKALPPDFLKFSEFPISRYLCQRREKAAHTFPPPAGLWSSEGSQSRFL